MTVDFLSALKAEIAALDAEIRADPRHRKLQRLRDTLDEYEPQRAPEVHQGIVGLGGNGSLVANATVLTKEERVRAEVTRLCQQHGTLHRKDILKHLMTAGLMGTEKDPLQALAIYLSNWKDEFDFDGNGNWSLRKTRNAGWSSRP